MRATPAANVIILTLFVLAGCGGGSDSTTPPPPPPPPPAVSNPKLMWPGDVQVNSGLGDDGIGDSGPSGAAIVPDLIGGATIAWEDHTSALVHVQRIDVNGNKVWQSTGVSPSDVNTYQGSPQAVSDGSGGVILAWVDGRAGSCDETNQFECDIYAQRIDSSGNLLWDSSGVAVVTAPHNQGSSGIAMISDGIGGAIVAWEDARAACCTIDAQRIAGTGQVLWQVDGIQVSPSPTIVIGTIGVPQMISDGSGGAIVAWWNTQNADPDQEFTVSTQRLDQNGNLLWGATGVTVSGLISGPRNGNAPGYALTSDRTGGAIFVGGVIDGTATGIATTQRVDGAGQVMWGANSVQVSATAAHELNPVVVEDGLGGAIIFWNSCQMQGVECSISTQHVDPSGHLSWAAGGVSITQTPNRKYGPLALSDGAGGAIVTWEDCPSVTDPSQCAEGIDLYGQRINSAGLPMWEANGFPISTNQDNQGVQTGNLNAGIYASRDNLGNTFFAWPDGRINHRCAYMPIGAPSHCDLFTQSIH